MQVIQTPRCAGKTYRLVQEFRRLHTQGRHAIFLAATYGEAERVAREYSFTDSERRWVVIAREDCLRGLPPATVLADNVDWMLSRFVGGSIDVGTVNG